MKPLLDHGGRDRDRTCDFCRVKAHSSGFAAQVDRSEPPLTSSFVILCCPLLSPRVRRVAAPARPTQALSGPLGLRSVPGPLSNGRLRRSGPPRQDRSGRPGTARPMQPRAEPPATWRSGRRSQRWRRWRGLWSLKRRWRAQRSSSWIGRTSIYVGSGWGCRQSGLAPHSSR